MNHRVGALAADPSDEESHHEPSDHRTGRGQQEEDPGKAERFRAAEVRDTPDEVFGTLVEAPGQRERGETGNDSHNNGEGYGPRPADSRSLARCEAGGARGQCLSVRRPASMTRPIHAFIEDSVSENE